MRVAIPHSLGREEARRRLRERSHEIADHIPGGMAQVTTNWTGEDRLHLAVGAMGHTVDADVDVEENQVIFQVTLPPSLGFFRPIIEAAVRSKGTKLLAPPES